MATQRICLVDGCGKLGRASNGFCWTHYRRMNNARSPEEKAALKAARRRQPLEKPARQQTRLEYLSSVVAKFEGDECLPWPFGRNRRGYGVLWVNGTVDGTHRVLCKLVHGDPPTPTHQAAHSCGNGHLGCVNPRHIRWATPIENMTDRMTHGSITWTHEQVRKIRLAPRTREVNKQLAAETGLSLTTVRDIRYGIRAKWLAS